MPPWMKNNRRRDSGVVRLWPMMKLITCFAILVAAAMLSVRQHTQNAVLAGDIELCRRSLEKMQEDNRQMALQITQLEAPTVLQKKNEDWQLGLVTPYESQIIRVRPEWPSQPTRLGSNNLVKPNRVLRQ